MKYKHSKEELEIFVKESLSISEVCRKLGIKPAGGNYTTLNKKIKDWGIDIKHFTGAAWNQGSKFKAFGIKIDLPEILICNSPYNNTTRLKEKLIFAGLKNKNCECCKLSEWMDKPIPLELHHINGIRDDNRIENLQLLCPNCHSYTDNYRGRNIKKGDMT